MNLLCGVYQFWIKWVSSYFTHVKGSIGSDIYCCNQTLLFFNQEDIFIYQVIKLIKLSILYSQHEEWHSMCQKMKAFLNGVLWI